MKTKKIELARIEKELSKGDLAKLVGFGDNQSRLTTQIRAIETEKTSIKNANRVLKPLGLKLAIVDDKEDFDETN